MFKMNTKLIRIGAAVTYVLMVTVNILANVIPINGVTTGEVSDQYENLFAPAGITFSIWGLIYFLLGLYTLYQLYNQSESKSKLLNQIGIYFIISSLANTLWIFTWHYNLIPISVGLILIMLICLILINHLIVKEHLTIREQFFIRLPFSVYFGWITVATIANITVLLVYLNWNGFGLSDSTWAIIVLILGVIIGILTMLRNKDVAYGLVFIWAYLGILFKHLSPEGFNGQYPSVIITIIICIVLLFAAEVYLLFFENKRVK